MKRKIVFFIISAFAITVAAQQSHSVKQGETIESIAKQYNVTVDEIKNQNPTAEIIFPGLLLNIPRSIQADRNEEEKAEKKKTDRIEMRDGSYVLCKVISVSTKTGIVSFKQEDIDGILTLSTTEINYIEYEYGSKRRFKK